MVSPGHTIDTIGDLLDTAPCNGAPKSGTPCDDNVLNGKIVAGPNGIAETFAFRGPTGLNLTSAWRNPQHNEAVNGVLDSSHRFGNAVDVAAGIIPSLTKAQVNCMLKTAASMVGSVSIAEVGARGFHVRTPV